MGRHSSTFTEETTTISREKEANNMMFFPILFILPLALAYNDDCVYPEPVQCDWESETDCLGGEDANGCPLPRYCIPMKSDVIGIDGELCYNTCQENCNGENQILCDMGNDDNGCYMGAYCAIPLGDCPATCEAPCSADTAYCDNGEDDNGCWLGNYCAAECAETTVTQN